MGSSPTSGTKKMIIGYIVVAFAFLFAGIVSVLVLIGLLRTAFGESPFVPSAHMVCRRLVQEMPLPRGSVWYDLGAGDGRVARAMAKAYPESTCIGVELRLLPYLLGLLWLWLRPLPNAQLQHGDIYRASVSDATHIYLYLFPHVIAKLFPLIAAQVRPGTIIASVDFPYLGKEPERVVIITESFHKHTLYLYKI